MDAKPKQRKKSVHARYASAPFCSSPTTLSFNFPFLFFRELRSRRRSKTFLGRMRREGWQWLIGAAHKRGGWVRAACRRRLPAIRLLPLSSTPLMKTCRQLIARSILHCFFSLLILLLTTAIVRRSNKAQVTGQSPSSRSEGMWALREPVGQSFTI